MTTVMSAYGPIRKDDYGLIMAIGQDKAESRRRKRYSHDPKKRNTRWNVDDWNAMCGIVDSLTKVAAGQFPVSLFGHKDASARPVAVPHGRRLPAARVGE